MCRIIEMNARCEWAKAQIEIDYHDNEWGVPLHNDRKLFEFLVLEGMQAGLSWRIILNKRQEFRKYLIISKSNKSLIMIM